MYNHLQKVRDLFSDYKSDLHICGMMYSLVGYREVTAGNHLNPGSCRYLYVITDRNQLDLLDRIPHMSFLFLTEDPDGKLFYDEEDSLFASVLTVCTVDIKTVIGILQEYFDRTNGTAQWAESLLSILFTDGGIQEIVAYAHAVFMNPIYVFDPDFRLVASTIGLEENVDPVGRHIQESGGFTQEEFRLMNQQPNIHDRLKASKKPMFIQLPGVDLRILASDIDPEKDMGHFVIAERNRKLTETDLLLANTLKLALDQQMKKDEFIRNNRGFHYEYFLRDVLDGRTAIGRHYRENVSFINNEFYGYLTCMVIETARSSRVVNTMHLRALFETKYPDSMTLMYHGAVVIVFRHYQVDWPDEKTIREIRGICEEYGVYAGMSNGFDDIMNLEEYYHQALRAIELGTGTAVAPSLFVYQDYYMEHLTGVFRSRESSEAFMHPQMKVLFEYDEVHHTDYARLLYTWLLCERHLNKTAEALFIHRNTLIYRLKKLNEIIQPDYEDPGVRQHLILSYEMMKQGRQAEGKKRSAGKERVKKDASEEDMNRKGSENLCERICAEIRKDPTVSQRDLAEKVGESYHTIRAQMNEMREEGSLIRAGNSRAGKWILMDQR